MQQEANPPRKFTELEKRVDRISEMQMSGIQGMTYVRTLIGIYRTVPDAIDGGALVFQDLFHNATLQAFMAISHALDKDTCQNLTVKSVCCYSKGNLKEFESYHRKQANTPEENRKATLTAMADKWISWADAHQVGKDVQKIRDWTIAHRDKRVMARIDELPAVSYESIEATLVEIGDFVNEFMNAICATHVSGDAVELQIASDLRNLVAHYVASRRAFYDDPKHEERFTKVMDGLQAGSMGKERNG